MAARVLLLAESRKRPSCHPASLLASAWLGLCRGRRVHGVQCGQLLCMLRCVQCFPAPSPGAHALCVRVCLHLLRSHTDSSMSRWGCFLPVWFLSWTLCVDLETTCGCPSPRPFVPEHTQASWYKRCTSYSYDMASKTCILKNGVSDGISWSVNRNRISGTRGPLPAPPKTGTPSATPTATPTSPTNAPTSPTRAPTKRPTQSPTKAPTRAPTAAATSVPTSCHNAWDLVYATGYCNDRKEHCSSQGFAAHCLLACGKCHLPAGALAECADGSVFSTTASKCVDCSAGTADTDKDPVTPCAVCPIGTYAGKGSTACRFCGKGTADLDRNSATPCTSCKPGEFSNLHSFRCDQCGTGYFDDDRNPSTNCKRCPVGSYSALGSTSCQPCAAGTADTDQNPSTPCTATKAPTPNREHLICP